MKVKDIVTKDELDNLSKASEVPTVTQAKPSPQLDASKVKEVIDSGVLQEVANEVATSNNKTKIRQKLKNAFKFLLNTFQVAGTVAEVIGALVPAVGIAGTVANAVISGVRAVAQGSGIVEMMQDAGEMFNSRQEAVMGA
jgi:hypothetical protein